MYFERHVQARIKPYEGTDVSRERPVWKEIRFIKCYLCYWKGNTYPRFTEKLCDICKIIEKYQALKEEDQQTVLDGYYKAALLLAMLRENKTGILIWQNKKFLNLKAE